MDDVFKEQLVKKEPTRQDVMKKTGLIAAAVLISFAAWMFIPGFALLITFAAAFGVYYFLGLFKVEYEYIFTNGELDIDGIYNMSKRKRLFSGAVKNFEIMALLEDKVHAGDFHSAQETKDYSSGKNKEKAYAFLTVYEDKRVKIIIEPDEKMLQAFATVLTPRKLFQKK